MKRIHTILLAACLIGILWLAYYQQIATPQRLRNCNDTAINIEGLRGSSDTTTDISLYLKNLVSCLAN